MNIGKIISELRKEQNIAQGELAKKAKLTHAALSKIESGKTKRPSTNSLESICKALGISINELNILALEISDMGKNPRAGAEQILKAIKDLVRSVRKEVNEGITDQL